MNKVKLRKIVTVILIIILVVLGIMSVKNIIDVSSSFDRDVEGNVPIKDVIMVENYLNKNII